MNNGIDITIKELERICKKEIESGNGDKVVFISDDDEGNGFHQLYYTFTTEESEVEELLLDTFSNTNGLDYKDIALLG